MTKTRKPVVRALSETNLSLELRRKALALAVSAAFAQGAYALPTGGTAEVGSMVITTPTTNSMVITHSTTQNVDRFGSFNTTSGETVRVNFTNGGSAFYRVGDPVSFYGALSSNGRIFLSSPGGILFGAGSVVDGGSLGASTLSMSNADYLAGRYVFTNQGATGDVVNKGTILVPTGGYAALIGPRVSNEGLIVAQMGTVALAAGNKVTLDMIGDGLVKVVVDEAALNASAMNKGTIEANGGTILIGGNFHGAGAEQNASMTYVGSGATIKADAVSTGNGGNVAVWSNDVTRFAGSITARGGAQSGDGGSVETSGGVLVVGGSARVDTSAPHGKNGNWLLDPLDITVQTG